MRPQEVNHSQWLQAAQTAASVQLAYAQRGVSLAHAALAGSTSFEELQHYPKGDVSDMAAGTKFYYHAHRRDDAEHGHFHLFSYLSTQPGDFVHLAALSLNHQGLATRWFSTNQWVTGEKWAPADQVIAALAQFRVTTRGRLAPLARWLTAMVQLFRPQLQDMIRQRDLAIQKHCTKNALPDVLANRNIDVLSDTPADLHQRIKQLGV